RVPTLRGERRMSAQRRAQAGLRRQAHQDSPAADRWCPRAHSPLAKGVLTGRYTPGHVFAADDERAQMAHFQGDEFSRLLAWTVSLRRWAEERGHTLLEPAIPWVLSHPAVTVCLCGAKSHEQIDDHVRAASWNISTDDRRDIDRLLGSTAP